MATYGEQLAARYGDHPLFGMTSAGRQHLNRPQSDGDSFGAPTGASTGSSTSAPANTPAGGGGGSPVYPSVGQPSVGPFGHPAFRAYSGAGQSPAPMSGQPQTSPSQRSRPRSRSPQQTSQQPAQQSSAQPTTQPRSTPRGARSQSVSGSRWTPARTRPNTRQQPRNRGYTRSQSVASDRGTGQRSDLSSGVFSGANSQDQSMPDYSQYRVSMHPMYGPGGRDPISTSTDIGETSMFGAPPPLVSTNQAAYGQPGFGGHIPLRPNNPWLDHYYQGVFS